MGSSKLNLEKTAAGMQYVIPGTERITKLAKPSYPSEHTPSGDQLVIPGAERISTKEYVARLVTRPLEPRRRQVGLQGTALFSNQQPR